jgi:hypothetical protein
MIVELLEKMKSSEHEKYMQNIESLISYLEKEKKLDSEKSKLKSDKVKLQQVMNLLGEDDIEILSKEIDKIEKIEYHTEDDFFIINVKTCDKKFRFEACAPYIYFNGGLFSIGHIKMYTLKKCRDIYKKEYNKFHFMIVVLLAEHFFN